MRSPLKRGSRYATFKSFLRSAVRPAVNSYICFGWIMRHTFCIAEDHWEKASLSARSLTPLAFATTLISHESFDIGSGTRQAPTQKDLVIRATEQCAPILMKARHRLTTSNARHLTSSQMRQQKHHALGCFATRRRIMITKAKLALIIAVAGLICIACARSIVRRPSFDWSGNGGPTGRRSSHAPEWTQCICLSVALPIVGPSFC
jgi:hypothetical protein